MGAFTLCLLGARIGLISASIRVYSSDIHLCGSQLQVLIRDLECALWTWYRIFNEQGCGFRHVWILNNVYI